jgi:hypothetical protein
MNKAVITRRRPLDINWLPWRHPDLPGPYRQFAPQPLIIKRSREFGVAILLVPANTMERSR